MPTKRNPWGGEVSRAAVLSLANRIKDRDGVSWAQALRKALTWARSKAGNGEGGNAAPPADPYAVLRARGVFSPRDTSPDAMAHFAARARLGRNRWGGR